MSGKMAPQADTVTTDSLSAYPQSMMDILRQTSQGSKLNTIQEQQPNVQDTNSFEGWVWVVLFTMVMAMSCLANLTLTVTVLRRKLKRQSLVFNMLVFMFLVNVIDYALLSFEFSLGISHVWPYGLLECKVYMVALKINPIIQGSAVVMLLLCTWRAISHDDLQGKNKLVLLLVGLILGLIGIAFAIPTWLHSKILSYSSGDFCEVSFEDENQLALFDMAYSSVFSYWIPLLVRYYFILYALMNLKCQI